MQQQPANTAEVESPPPRPAAEPAYYQGDSQLHWIFLSLSSVVLALALILQVRGEEDVVIPGLQVALPGTCTFKKYAGADCPGCGLTRCFVSMAHADVRRAWHFNPMGIALFVLVVSQIPFRATQLWRLRSGLPEIRLGRWGYWLLTIIVAGLLLQWAIRMIFWLV